MLCSRCKKRAAMFFVSLQGDAKGTQGLCEQCARELGGGPIKDIMQKMGISDQDFLNIQENISQALKDSSEGFKVEEPENLENEDSGDYSSIKNLFSNIIFPGKDGDFENILNRSSEDGKSKNKKSKRKNLDLLNLNV